MGGYLRVVRCPVECVKDVHWHQYFSIYFDAVILMALGSHWEQNKGIAVVYLHNAELVGNRQMLQLETLVTDLEYADDMALFANSWDDLQTILTSLSTYCWAFGLLIGCEKTKHGSPSV